MSAGCRIQPTCRRSGQATEAGTADVVYDKDIVSLQALRELIGSLHYRLLSERETSKTSFKGTACLLLMIILLYVLLQQWGALNFLCRTAGGRKVC